MSSSVQDSTGRSVVRTSLWFSSLHTLGTSILSIPLGVLSSILIARALGPAGKGSYDLVLATTMLLNMVLGFSLPSGITYVVARGRAALGSLSLRLGAVALLQGLLAAVLLTILQQTRYSAAFLPPQMGRAVIAVIVLSLIFSVLSGYWRAMLIGRQEIVRANRVDLLGRALYLTLLLSGIGVLTVLKYPPSPLILIWINGGVVLLTSLIFLKVLRPYLAAPASSPSGFREIVGYSFPCYLANLTQFLNYRLDVFIVSFFYSVEGVGLYTLAVSLAQLIWLISNAAATALLPKVAALQEAVSENVARTAQMTRFSLWLSFLSALFLALLAGPAIPWVYGEVFQQCITALLGLLPGIVAFSIVNVLASYISGIGKPQLNLMVSLVGLGVTITFDLLLIPRFYIIGAAIASTLSYSISALLTTWIFVRKSGIPARKVLIWTWEDGSLMLSLAHRILGPLASKWRLR